MLAAPIAHAQTTTYDETSVQRTPAPMNNRDDERTLNKAECIRNDTFSFNVESSLNGVSGSYQLEVWAGTGCISSEERGSDGDCRLVGSGEASNDTRIDIRAQNILADGNGREPPAGTEDDCASSVPGTTDVTLFFLLVAGDNSVPAVPDTNWATYVVTYDMNAPDAPTGVSAGIGESALVVSWTEPETSEGLDKYRFYCEPLGGLVGEGGATGSAGASGTPTDGCSASALVPGEAAPDGYDCGSTSSTSTNGEASGLENGQTYAVAVASVDAYGNVGVLSDVACGTPEPVTGFFEAYRDAGGQAGGGYCATHAGKSRLSAALVGLALLGLVFRRRRTAPRGSRAAWSKAAGLFALGATLLTFSGTAQAQGVDEFGAYGGLEDRGQRRSPQEAAFEIRVGPYRPKIDDAVPGTPYKDIFGGSQRWHAGFEVDWQVFRIERTLSLGPGFSLAYTRAGAKAPLASGAGRSAQDTELEMLPMFLAGVLRIDALADRTAIPLAPYAKLGFGYALWWASDGEDSARADGVVGKGASYGYTYSLGVLLRLDPLDPADAASADASLGINHSGIFIEWFGSSLDGFGSNDVLEVGTNTWVAGLTIEM